VAVFPVYLNVPPFKVICPVPTVLLVPVPTFIVDALSVLPVLIATPALKLLFKLVSVKSATPVELSKVREPPVPVINASKVVVPLWKNI
jgi:hypothetical protein